MSAHPPGIRTPAVLLPVPHFTGCYGDGCLSAAAAPFNAFVELMAFAMVTFAALMPGMFTPLHALAGFTLRAFTALTFLVLPVLAPVFIIDLNDTIRRRYSDRRHLSGRCRRAG